jgi:hypothetical protein
VWLATTEEHHQSLRREFPNMRSIQVLGKKVTGWQVLPADAKDFEEAALRACLSSREILESGRYLERGAPRDRGPSRRQDLRSGRNSPRMRSRDECEKRPEVEISPGRSGKTNP